MGWGVSDLAHHIGHVADALNRAPVARSDHNFRPDWEEEDGRSVGCRWGYRYLRMVEPEAVMWAEAQE